MEPVTAAAVGTTMVMTATMAAMAITTAAMAVTTAAEMAHAPMSGISAGATNGKAQLAAKVAVDATGKASGTISASQQFLAGISVRRMTA